MTISVRRSVASKLIVASLCGAATAMPQMVGAQDGHGAPAVAGRAFAGDTAGPPKRPEPPQCIHRAIDDRPSSNSDDNRLTVWLSVHQPTIAAIKVSGSATGPGTGTFAITLMRDGIPISSSQERRGTGLVYAGASAHVKLVPGQQYKITAKPTLSYKKLIRFEMIVGVGGTCP